MKKAKAAAVPTTVEGTEVPVKKWRKIVNIAINVLLVVAIVFAALCTYMSFSSKGGKGVPNIFGTAFFSVQTDSMYPTLLPGDLVVAEVVNNPKELRPGDIITYWTIIDGEKALNTHRIHEIRDGGTFWSFITKGDKNDTPDPLPVHESAIVGKYSYRIQNLGNVFDYLQTSTGFLIVIVVPVFLFFVYQLIQFFRVLFEYQNVKNRIRYEEERGEIEDKEEKQKAEARAAMEAELREKLRAELLADMEKQQSEAAEAEAAPEAEPEVPAEQEDAE
ncbi:MAG: signal peptidase I [Ruminococcaceae bacterium]|nr:signal peptidase I [Oscillospiraceae bacterium]